MVHPENYQPSQFKIIKYSFPKKVEYLIIGTICLMIAGLVLLLAIHYFHVSLIFQYPNGNTVNFTVSLLMLGGILTLLTSLALAGILFLSIIHKIVLKKEKVHVNYSKVLQNVFIGVTMLMIIIGLIVLPLSCQYIENNVNNSYINLIKNEKPIETNYFQLTNIETIELGIRNFSFNTRYTLAFVSSYKTLTLPFHMEISFLNETSNEIISLQPIYARSYDFITVKNELTNEYYHMYSRQVELPTELQMKTFTTANMTARISESNSINSQTVTIHFIEDQDYILQKGHALSVTTGYFRSYGMIISLSSIVLLMDLLLLLKARSSDNKNRYKLV